jgi:hypothetical protein
MVNKTVIVTSTIYTKRTARSFFLLQILNKDTPVSNIKDEW